MSEKVTIATVARHARVSRQTVSNVLNAPHIVREETRQRVQEAIAVLGYRANQAARQMRTGRSRLIAVRIEPTRDGINGSVLDRFLHGLTETADAAGYRVMLYTAGDDDQEIATYDDLLGAYDLDAFVLTGTKHGDPRTAWLADRGVPFVTFGRPWDDPESHPWVDVDNADGTAQATRRLLDTGHRRIAFIGWPEGSGVGDDRRTGWRTTLAAAGLDTDLHRATWDGIAEGERAMRDLLHLAEPPTAVVCASDSLALGALQAVGTAAPQVAVVGFDDTPVAAAVGLTSVSQPLAAAAARCVELLTGVLDGTHQTDPHVLLQPALVLRHTA
ncbi:LacI family transcriptional regulator [Micromonospora globispora]|uniref:LacI family transcriptional regulator n=1 Tax=Micromonospora globispora TaxID=1450148 RepID=A0A317JRC5_9ACTN|nr:LacI family DNA-binding transcriptional regulator [Micromonospora globispora]PWU43125.1 LacI family transcriptional regulator [Micromonospora globispora]PWU55318.1 LacI family transcriptional regulator [Micromonospora globispora]RQW86327.1 LacI family transcriptional regulator [Micromonospora globispora]